MYILNVIGVLCVIASLGRADEANLSPECLEPPPVDVVCRTKKCFVCDLISSQKFWY